MGWSLKNRRMHLLFSGKYLTGGIMSQLKISDLSFCEIESPEAEAAEGGMARGISSSLTDFSSLFSGFGSLEEFKQYYSKNPLPDSFYKETFSGIPGSGKYSWAAVGRDGLGGVYSLSSAKMSA
jgi:hypothetical protein